jgi:hypothetical protein
VVKKSYWVVQLQDGGFAILMAATADGARTYVGVFRVSDITGTQPLVVERLAESLVRHPHHGNLAQFEGEDAYDVGKQVAADYASSVANMNSPRAMYSVIY